MAKAFRLADKWPFGRKFDAYLTDKGVKLNTFAEREGIPQSTLQGWVKEGVRVPDGGLAKIASATGLPADYWIREDVPYPPPLDYEGLVDEAVQALRTLNPAQVRAIIEMARDRADLERTLALRKTARA